MKQYVVDAFTNQLFHGNQAAICILDHWIAEETMMNIAKENNFSETAFAVKEGEVYRLRWFTPADEIDFCGHATLACSYVLFNYYEKDKQEIVFNTMVGELIVKRDGDEILMNMPAYNLNPIPVTIEMEEAIGVTPCEAYKDRDLMLVLDTENQVINLNPNIEKLKELDGLGIMVTAKGVDYDCISRYFAPELSIPEDLVTGSAHCMIGPYWGNRLGKEKLNCYQASERGGSMRVELQGERVLIAGKAVLFSISELMINE